MELAAIEEENQEASFFERAIFIITPIVFVVVLLGVLVMMFNIDLRNQAIAIGQEIPIVRNLLPEPSASSNSSDEEIRSEKFNQKIVELESQLTSLEEALAQAEAKTIEQEAIIATLSEQNEASEQVAAINQVAGNEEVIDSEAYSAKIQELASMFSKMTPSKAAPIIQSMTLEEMALLFNQMRSDDRVRIMEKMNPKTAADVTLLLKDNVKAKDLEIAALQARIDQLQEGTGSEASSEATDADLAETFKSMDPQVAADLLLKMMDISSSKVLRILNVTDSAARSAILEEMSAKNESTAALLVTRLMPN